MTPSTTATSASRQARSNSSSSTGFGTIQLSRLRDGRPQAIVWWLGSM
ncbi:MAG TPA: hypothetical protein VF960_02970 [Chloroflexota bacterium]